MSRKSPIIKLGRSKSQKRVLQRDNSSNRFGCNTHISSRDTLQESSTNFNQSVHTEDIYEKQNVQLTKCMRPSDVLAPKKYPLQSPNKTSVIRNTPNPVMQQRNSIACSPSKIILNGSNPYTLKKVENQRQLNLLRKIQVLEKRIQQVHQQKQRCLINLHEQNHHLSISNQNLKNQLILCEQQKNKEIINLQREVLHLNTQLQQSSKVNHSSQKSEGEIKKSLKNVVYVDDEEDITSLADIEVLQYKEEPEHQKDQSLASDQQHQKLLKQIHNLEQKNKLLNQELQQMKDAVLHTTGLIEENNQNIIDEYQTKFTLLQQKNQEQILQYKEKQNNFLTQIAELQNLLKQQLAKSEKVVNDCQTQTDEQKQKQKLGNHESCQRCKQLIKTLVKLNQKTFSKVN